MRVFLIKMDQPIAPFAEPAREASIGGPTLSEYHERLFARLGGHQVESLDDLSQLPQLSTPCLVLQDNLFVTHRALRSFLSLAKKQGGHCRLALPDSLLLQRYHPLQQLPRDPAGNFLFNAVYCDALAATPGQDFFERAQPLLPKFKEKVYTIAIPPNIIGRNTYRHPVTTTIAIQIRHWVHILWANNLLPQIQLVERITQSPLATIWRLLTSVGLSRNAMLFRAMKRFSYMGKRCRIHPTAQVELSILGDDVEIGAYALVRGAVIGSGSVLEERACVFFSTLANSTFVSRNSTLIGCASYPNSDLCVNGIQFSLAGRHSALTSFVRQLDMQYKAPVTVMDNGTPVALEEQLLGGCFGHRVYVGPDVMIQAGRAIPNGTVLLPPTDRSLVKPPTEWPEGQLATVHHGQMDILKRS